MAYPIGIFTSAGIVFLLGMEFSAPKFIVIPVSILLLGFGIYELAFGRKDDKYQIEAPRNTDKKQLNVDTSRYEELAEQENRWRNWTQQREAEHRAEMQQLMERIASISNERITQISGQINELAQKYKNSSIISNLSAREIEEEVQKREAQIKAESQKLLDAALREAEANHKAQLSSVQAGIKAKYDKLIKEKEQAYSYDLAKQAQEIEKVSQNMQREQDKMIAQLNDQHEMELARVKLEFDTDQRKAIAAVTKELAQVKKENAQLEADKEKLQKELECRLADMESRGECEHYQDKQIYDLLLRLMKQVKYRMDIICPWASHGVVNDKFLKMIAKMANKDVELYICYGYSEKDKRLPETETCLKAIESVYREKGKSDKINIRFRKTHEKIIMCDDDLYFSTSCNVLSNPVVNGTGEGGILFHDKKSVEYRREKDFSFSGSIYFSDLGKPKN